MMKYLLIMYSIFFLSLSSCTHKINTNTENNLQYNNYISTKKKLKKNNYQNAIAELETLQKKHPYSSYKNQIYFDLIYGYYKIKDFSSAYKTINNFITSNPNHPNIDYLLYMKGLINMELDNNLLITNKLLKLNYQEKNPIYAEKSFHDFSELIYKYPKSPYIIDAQKRLIYLKNRIAEHELSIIKFYNKKEAYITVINRTEDMLRYFPDTQATHKALLYMQIAYQKLNLLKQSDTIIKIIAHNKNQKYNTQ